MAYDPNPNHGPRRDETHPSEIARERPIAATRIHNFITPEPGETVHSGQDGVNHVNEWLRKR